MPAKEYAAAVAAMRTASAQRSGPRKGSNKYGAVRTVFGDQTFDSRRECERWISLRALERAGEISDLKRQVRFPLEVFGKLICTYVADFTYRDKAGAFVVEDSKGHRTREYVNKAKLFAALHGFSIREV
jgi:hypothetical protein